VIRWSADALVVATWLISMELVYHYHRVSKGAWRYSPVGRHVMVFMGVIALVLFSASTRIFIVDVLHRQDYIVFQAFRVITFLTIPAVMLWRRAIITRSGKMHRSVTWRDSDGDDGPHRRAGEDLFPVPTVERQQRWRRDEDSGQPGGQEGPDADQAEGRRPRMGDGGQRRR
jgi:hypothetical protein